MKRINRLIFIFAILLTLLSCENSNKIKFYGETVTVAYPKHIETLNKGNVLELEGEYTGLMSALVY